MTQDKTEQAIDREGYEPPISTTASDGVSSWFAFSNPSYLKGFALAAGITLVATSPKVRQSIVNGSVKAWTFLQGSLEELKEKVQDTRAEMGQNAQAEASEGQEIS